MAPELAVIVHPRFPLEPVSVQKQCQAVLGASRRDRFEALPGDVLHLVASYIVSAQDLLRFSMINKRCEAVANDEVLWQRLVMERFGWVPCMTPPSWRALYRFNHELFVNIILQHAAEKLMHVRMGNMPHMPPGFIPVFA